MAWPGMRRVRGHLAEPSHPCEVLVAYGGTETQQRSDGKLVPWADLHRQAWKSG